MTDSEITKLSYLADRLMGDPDNFSQHIEECKGSNDSEECTKVLTLLSSMFKLHDPSSSYDVKKLIEFMDQTAESYKKAVEVLKWAEK